MQTLLQHGDVDGRYDSRSEVIQALATAAAYAGWSLADLFHEVMNRLNVGGDKVQEIAKESGDQAAYRYLERSWKKAMRFVETRAPITNATEARKAIAEIRAEAGRATWKGIAGGTDLAVLRVHLDIADRLGRIEYSASTRQVAEQAGVTWPTVHRSHRRLVASGWIAELRKGLGPNATQWRLRGQRKPITLLTSGGYE